MRRWIELVTEDHAAPEFLYHGTWRGNVDDILADGLTGPSYWGAYEIAQSYSMQFGEEGVIIRVPLSSFDEDGLQPNENLVSSMMDSDEEAEMITTWQQSLEVVDSVVYEFTLTVDRDDFIQS